jgi:Ti-type conjugative transfer relaxase TraA
LEAQGIDLEPQNKIGPAASRMVAQGLAPERLAEHQHIARENGDRIIANPRIALDAITHGQATFTTRDLAKFIHRHSAGQEQFDRAMAKVRGSPELILLGKDCRGEARFSSRDMLRTEELLKKTSARLVGRETHSIPAAAITRSVAATGMRGLVLGKEQELALRHITRGSDFTAIVGYAGSGKSALLGVAREAWEEAGYRVQGLALSGIAAENLESGSGIVSRTIASLEHQWAQGRDVLSNNDVLVIDEAGMIGTRQMERIVSEAEKRGAKLVLVGDPEQLQAIEAGAAFRAIAERHGAVEITGIRRQQEEWQRDATRHLATGRTSEAIGAYDQRGALHAAVTRKQARAKLIERWDADRTEAPAASRIILAHTNNEVRVLNEAARDQMRQAGELGADVRVTTERGNRSFAEGDRIMFLRNERSLEVKNGSIGTVKSLTPTSMTVLLDNGRDVTFDLKDYAHVDHGYAATIHKSQGVTVDRAHVLATPGLDRHAAYVALSRHREGVSIHYGQDDFASRDQLVRTLSRERQKDLASDYVKDFADRRAIVLPQKAQPARQLSMIDQLVSAPQRKAPQRPSLPPLQDAVRGFAKTTLEIVRVRQRGLQETPQQRAAFDQARHALDAVRPNGARDLRAAFQRDMGMIEDTVSGKVTNAIRAMDWEKRYRTEPQFRAEHFVRTWKQLGDRHEAFERHGDERSAQRIAAQMTGFAKSLERDPQVESLLRTRKADLGLPEHIERPLSQSLPNWIGWGRGRGIER